MFKFKIHPAAINVGDGIGHAFEFMGLTWRWWLPVVGAMAAVSFVVFLFVFDVIGDGLYYVNRWTNEIEWVPDAGDRIWRIAPYLALYAAAGMVASWVITGVAVAGLRGWKLTASVVVRRGLVTLVSALIVGAAFAGGMLAWAMVAVTLPPIGLLAIFVAVPLAIYAALRISFFSLAVFEGFGPIGGLQESWRVSEGAVWRILGWELMAALIGIGFSVIGAIASAPLTSSDTGSMAASQAISGATTIVTSVFSVFLLAVLYESQRARHDRTLYPVAAYPYPAPPIVYPYQPQAYPPAAYPPSPEAGPGQTPPDGTGTGSPQS